MSRIDAILAAVDSRRELTKTEALELAEAYREAMETLVRERAEKLAQDDSLANTRAILVRLVRALGMDDAPRREAILAAQAFVGDE